MGCSIRVRSPSRATRHKTRDSPSKILSRCRIYCYAVREVKKSSVGTEIERNATRRDLNSKMQVRACRAPKNPLCSRRHRPRTGSHSLLLIAATLPLLAAEAARR